MKCSASFPCLIGMLAAAIGLAWGGSKPPPESAGEPIGDRLVRSANGPWVEKRPLGAVIWTDARPP